MKLGRRTFIGAAMSAAALSAMPAMAAPPLTIHGDGKADDTAAIQALLDGTPVMMGGQIIKPVDGNVRLSDGLFRISKTLKVTRSSYIENCVFYCWPMAEDELAFHVIGDVDCYFIGTTIDHRRGVWHL